MSQNWDLAISNWLLRSSFVSRFVCDTEFIVDVTGLTIEPHILLLAAITALIVIFIPSLLFVGSNINRTPKC